MLLSAWLGRVRALATPGPLFHATILCCQTGGLAFGIRAYITEGEKDRVRKAEAADVAVKRRADAAAIHALDRASNYFNAIRFYRLVLQLEAYRVKMERRASSNSWYEKLMHAGMRSEHAHAGQDWADVWLERRVALDAEAIAMEEARVELKNVWYLSKQAWECYPTQRELMHEFFFDAPLNSALGVRSLRLLEPMDRARFRRRQFEYARPSIYPFIASLYGIDDGDSAHSYADSGAAVVAGRSLDSQPWWFMQARRPTRLKPRPSQ